MAKAPAKSSEDKAPRAPRAPRNSAARAAADQEKESGAKAPVSLPGETASEADKSPQMGVQHPQADGPVQAAEPEERRSGAAFGMGSFPEGWEPTQTPENSSPIQAVQSLSWSLPDITEFPVSLTLVNNTRSTVVVRALGVRLRRFSEATVQCQGAEQYQDAQRELGPRALRERWDSEQGLQVKYGEERE